MSAFIVYKLCYFQAFPLNSNLTAYFSRGILNVIESGIMNEIEEKYFGKNEIGGEDSSAEISSAPLSLSFHSFAGLFIIAGISTLLALLISERFIWQTLILTALAFTQRYVPHFSNPVQDSTHGTVA